MKKYILLVSLLCTMISSMAQDMNAGFKMLEKGEFADAEVFFGEILKEYPDNKTAKLCYGRGVGLAGDPPKAIGVFEGLLEIYPGDMEVWLNLAEAYLWMKDPKPAINEYSAILKVDSTSFAAQLGIANSYSMDEQYRMSMKHILIALSLKPDNPQAALSAKFIRLGLANKLSSKEYKYEEAIAILGENLAINAEDQETLALLANIYLVSAQFDKADSIYIKIEDPIASLKGRAVALHLQELNESALQKSEEARTLGYQTKDIDIMVDVNTNYISALLWNNELKYARHYVDSLIVAHGPLPELVASQAQVAMYEADFTRGVEKFDTYLVSEPKSFKGNLGKADAMHALGMDNKAYDLAFGTLGYYPGQKDVLNFIGRLNDAHSPKAWVGWRFGQSSDKSSNYGWEAGMSANLSPLSSVSVNYEHRTFTSPGSSLRPTKEVLNVSGSRRVNHFVNLKGTYSVTKMQLEESSEYTYQRTLQAYAEMRVSKSQNLTVGYFTEVQDFNSALLQQNLKVSNYVIKNSMFWKIPAVGWYTEMYRSAYSDGNNRNLVFTSVYKSISTKAPMKFGVNLLYMTFDESKPENYYSPTDYKQVEAFAGLEYRPKKVAFHGMLDFAAGYQFLPDQTQLTWRTKATISQKVRRFNFEGSVAYSSISAAVSNGFSHLEIKAKLTWQLRSTPLFYKRVAATK